MRVPTTISEWLDERIGFIETYLSFNLNYDNQTDFIIAKHNYKYCKRLYSYLLKNKDDEETKRRFRNIAHKLILDIANDLDKQQYECINLHGCCFPTKEQRSLPQEDIDNIQRLRAAFDKIFNEIELICYN